MFTVNHKVLDGLTEYFTKLPERASQAAALAINQTVDRKFMPFLREEANAQINFPVGYLQSDERLFVKRKAKPGNLEAIVTARDRPTSLARFAPGFNVRNQRLGQLVVRVKKGGRAHRLSKKAFLVKLNNGNTGLAVRLAPGEQLRNTDRGVLVKSWSSAKGNVYLLYGPSVEQVISTIASDSIPKIAADVETEFLRQFQRLSRG